MHLETCKEASDQNKMSETRSGKCPNCRVPLPTIAPAYCVNRSLESIARACEQYNNDKIDKSDEEESKKYSNLLKKIASLQQELRWKNTTYQKKLAMILARDAAVPSLGEAAADDYDEDDSDNQNSDDDENEYGIVRLLREKFGERELTRSLVNDPTDSHMRLALSFISFPRKVRYDKPFDVVLAVLRFEEDECELIPPMMTEDDRRLLASDFNTSNVTSDLRFRVDGDQQKTLTFLDCSCESGVISVKDVVISSSLMKKNSDENNDSESEKDEEERRITVQVKLDDFNLSCIMSLPIELASSGEDDKEEEETNAFGGVRMEMGVVVGSDEEDDSFINDEEEEEDNSFIVRTSEEEEEEEDSVIVISSEDDEEEEEKIPKKTKRKRRKQVVDSDEDDEDQENHSEKKSQKKRRKAIVDSSSDDDDDEDETEKSRRKKRADAALARMGRFRN